eukprot:COSAG02_NODE_3411_length_6786_cov_70.963511_3_plen_35_part_00
MNSSGVARTVLNSDISLGFHMTCFSAVHIYRRVW